ncbi:type II toxin-antitoxin system HipA family toxin [Orrella sp. 11846]|uniref:type II toxin-antitoxin system HipA family toxin n=1 Tax=Orrella sp. 11846 TaxID=3409913 RepID=UPI003B59DD60
MTNFPNEPDSLAVFAHVAQRCGSKHQHGFVPAGLLQLTGEVQQFGYGKRYRERSYAVEIDPISLPLATSNGFVFPHGGLKEFGGIRDAAPDSWGRRVIESMLKVPAKSLPESMYLLHAGSDRVGALDVRQDLQSPAGPALGVTVDLSYLLQAAAMIEEGVEIPAALQPYFNGISSAGGARPKASVRSADGLLWLAKFPSITDRGPRNAVLEAGALEIARQSGIQVPSAYVEMVDDKAVLMIRRFDRYWAAPGQPLARGERAMDTVPRLGLTEGRVGQCTALTLIGCQESESHTKSYADIAKAIRTYCLKDCIAADIEELYARMVLNIFLTNDDDHLRNHSFSYDDASKGWRLSPLYDVVPRAQVSRSRRLHLDIGPKGKDATLDNALASFPAFFHNESKALSVMHRVWSAVRGWKNLYEQHGATQSELDYLSSAIRSLSDVASSAVETKIRRAQ